MGYPRTNFKRIAEMSGQIAAALGLPPWEDTPEWREKTRAEHASCVKEYVAAGGGKGLGVSTMEHPEVYGDAKVLPGRIQFAFHTISLTEYQSERELELALSGLTS